MPLAQRLAIFSPGSLSCPKWSCCKKRLPQPWHRTPFSTSLPSAANRDDKWATTCWIEPNQVKYRVKKTTSPQLLFCPLHILHDTAATSPAPPFPPPPSSPPDSVERTQWALLWVEVHWHVYVGGCIWKSDSTLWSMRPHLFSTAVPSMCIGEQTCWDVHFSFLFQFQFKKKKVYQILM